MLREFRVETEFVLNPEKLRTGSTPFVTRTRSGFQWTKRRSLLIFDEGHLFGGNGTLNSKLLASAEGIPSLVLSATIAESPLQLRALGYRLGLHNDRDFWRWCQRYGVRKGYFGGLEFDPESEEGIAGMIRLHESIFPHRGFRVDESEIAEQMPEHFETWEPLAVDHKRLKEIKAIYSKMEKAGEIEGITKALRERQAIELLKVPALTEEAVSIVEDGGSAIVFLNFSESIDSMLLSLTDTGVPCGVIDGRRSPRDCELARKHFENDETRIIIVQVAAGGVAIDLHDVNGKHPRVALICPQYSGAVEEQAIRRHVRAGAKTHATTRHLYVAGTVEEKAANTALAKRKNIERINRGLTTMSNKNTTTVEEARAEVTIETIEDRPHAEHGPSSLKFKAICPGWRSGGSSEAGDIAADRGRIGHAAVEKENPDMVPEDDPFLRDCVEGCITYVRRLKDTVEKESGGNFSVQDEIRVDFYKDQWGYFDRVIIDWTNKRAHLIDYKFAVYRYDANSPQFWAYVKGLFEAYPDKINEIIVHVPMPFRGAVDVERYVREPEHGTQPYFGLEPVATYDELCAKVSAIIEAAIRNNPAEYRVGRQCEYCSAAPGCPRLHNLAVAISEDFAPEELEAIPGIRDPEKIPEGAAGLIGQAKLLAPIMRSWAQKVDARAMEMILMEGTEIPGFRLKHRAAPARIIDPITAWKLVKDKLTPEQFAACSTLSITDLETAYADTFPRGKKNAARQELRELLLAERAAVTEGDIPYLSRIKN